MIQKDSRKSRFERDLEEVVMLKRDFGAGAHHKTMYTIIDEGIDQYGTEWVMLRRKPPVIKAPPVIKWKRR